MVTDWQRDKRAVIDLPDTELEERYRDVIGRQGQNEQITLTEISRRATLKVRDAAFEVRDAALKVHEASLKIVRLSERLERLTKVLIWLTGVLIFLAIFPAIDFVMKVTREHEQPAPVVAAPASEPELVPVKSTTATATATTATATSTATAPQKVEPRTPTTETKK